MNEPFHQLLIPEQEAVSPTTSPERLRELALQNDELALLIAQNFHTPSELLGELAQKYAREKKNLQYREYDANSDYNLAILKAITTNPNTPKEILLKLGAEFPQELVENSVFELLWLESPNLVAQMPIKTIEQLLFIEPVATLILEGALRDRRTEAIWVVAKHPKTPVNVLEKLAQDVNSRVREALVDNPNLPASILEILSQDSWLTMRCDVACHPNTSEKTLKKLSQDTYIEVRRHTATNPSVPVSILQVLAEDVNVGVRCKVAMNPNTPVNILQILAQDADTEVRQVASKRIV